MARRLAKNALANIGRGGITAAVGLVLPPILIRHMPAATYAVWVLALQAATYLSFLDFGLQAAVGRYIAYANEKRDPESRDGIFSTAFLGLSIACAIGLVVIAGIAWGAHRIFPSAPLELIPSLRAAILILGASAALGLPASTWNGVFVGLQRYDVPAVTIGVTRLLSAAGLVIASLLDASLMWMAIVVAFFNVLAYAIQFLVLGRIAPEMGFRLTSIRRSIIKELSGYCLGLSVWSVSMLLVNGFDLILVGRFQFSSVTPYAVSITLITFLAGLQNALFGVLMPRAAELDAGGDASGLGAMLLKTTQLGALLLLLTALPLAILARPVMGAWIGGQFEQSGGAILTVLVIANAVRLVGVPYASILMGTGQQRLVMISPMAEGLTNLGASILLGAKYGAIGVAWGTLIGAVVGTVANVLYNIPRTKPWIEVTRKAYLWRAVAVPLSSVLPVGLAAMGAQLCDGRMAKNLTVAGLLLSCIICGGLLINALFKQRVFNFQIERTSE